MSEHIFYPALSFSPLRIPGLKFWFNADSVAGASAATWNDETGTHKTLLKLEGYLAHDGDIESLLPLDHPYRNDPPE